MIKILIITGALLIFILLFALLSYKRPNLHDNIDEEIITQQPEQINQNNQDENTHHIQNIQPRKTSNKKQKKIQNPVEQFMRKQIQQGLDLEINFIGRNNKLMSHSSQQPEMPLLFTFEQQVFQPPQYAQITDDIDHTLIIYQYQQELNDLNMQFQPFQLIQYSPAIQTHIPKNIQNDPENVHQSSVVQSAKKILQSSPQLKRPDNIQKEKDEVKSFIQSINTSQDKKRAIEQVNHMYKNNVYIIGYEKYETDILNLAIQTLKQKQNKDCDEYFITQLIDGIGTCGQGRATRMIDVIGFASEQQIIPDYVINTKVQDKLIEMRNSNNISKDDFNKYLQTEFLDQKLITEKKKAEYLTWFDM